MGATGTTTEADADTEGIGTLTTLVLIAVADVNTAATDDEAGTDVVTTELVGAATEDVASVVGTSVAAIELDDTGAGAGSDDPLPSVKSTHPSYV